LQVNSGVILSDDNALKTPSNTAIKVTEEKRKKGRRPQIGKVYEGDDFKEIQIRWTGIRVSSRGITERRKEGEQACVL